MWKHSGNEFMTIKKLLVIYLLLGCVSPHKVNTNNCQALVSEINVLGGMEKHLICGKVGVNEGYYFTDITYYSWGWEWPKPDSLYFAPIDLEINEGDYTVSWIQYHDESFLGYQVK